MRVGPAFEEAPHLPAPATTDAKPVEATTAPVKKAAHKKVKIAHAKKAKVDGVAAVAVIPAIK